MRRSILGVLVLTIVVVGAGGQSACDRDDDDDVPIDGSRSDPPIHEVLCDPLGSPGGQGCNVGQKCAWVVVTETPDHVGVIRCVPDGVVTLGGACTVGSPGETSGFDDCQAGGVCVDGVCKDTCGFGGAGYEACAAGLSCTRYGGLWANGDDAPLYGACNPTCNPVAQLLADGSSCGVGQGCYLLTSATTSTAVCAGAGTVGHGVAITGQAFANSCLPGHQPRRASPSSMTIECGALCAPADVFVTDPADAEAGPRPTPRPAGQVTNFDAEGGRAPFTCASKGAAPPSDPTLGESCRYWWSRELFNDLSPYSNTVGWCFAHTRFSFDSDGDMTPDTPFPRCAALSSADKVPPLDNPPGDDARDFWCKSLPAMLTTSIAQVKRSLAAREPRLDRLGQRR